MFDQADLISPKVVWRQVSVVWVIYCVTTVDFFLRLDTEQTHQKDVCCFIFKQIEHI